MNLITNIDFVSFREITSQTAQTFFKKVTEQDKRIALAAVATIALFSLAYLIYKKFSFKAEVNSHREWKAKMTPVVDELKKLEKKLKRRDIIKGSIILKGSTLNKEKNLEKAYKQLSESGLNLSPVKK